jgi:hypothetical protein
MKNPKEIIPRTDDIDDMTNIYSTMSIPEYIYNSQKRICDERVISFDNPFHF